MTTYYLNGTQIVEGSDILLNGFTYPYSWLETTSQQVRASYGIEATGDINYDQRYYIDVGIPKELDDVEAVDEDDNPVYVKTLGEVDGIECMVDTEERMVNKGLKTICASEVKSMTNILLSPTDFYVIRNEVESLEIPANISSYRTAVVAEQDRVTTAIAAVTTVEDLIEVMNSITWPAAN